MDSRNSFDHYRAIVSNFHNLISIVGATWIQLRGINANLCNVVVDLIAVIVSLSIGSEQVVVDHLLASVSQCQ